jgi:hypothetical protein
VFNNATSGRLSPGNPNRWDAAHRDYNDAVEQMWNDFLQRNDIDPAQMTPEQVQEFVGEVMSSQNPTISNFNQQIQSYRVPSPEATAPGPAADPAVPGPTTLRPVPEPTFSPTDSFELTGGGLGEEFIP